MSGGTSPFAYTAPIGGSTSVTLPEISVGPGMPEPLAGGGGGALPGSGSYGDPISGFHQINQQAADFQKSFSAQTGAASNAANATFQAQNTARAGQAQAQFNANQANANASRSALFAGPTITGPILPPNFAQTAQKPAVAVAPPMAQAPTQPQPEAETPPTPPPAQTPYLQGLLGAAMDGRAASFVADHYRQGVEQRGGALLPSLGSVLNGTMKAGEQGREDLEAMARSIAESLDYFQKGVDGAISLNDPETGLPTDEAVRHSFNLATLGMTGGFGGVTTRAGETVLGAGPVRRVPGATTGLSAGPRTPTPVATGARIPTNMIQTPNGLVDLSPTLDRIAARGTNPHPRDGSIFRNDQQRLPNQLRGYYQEFVHPTPGLIGPGEQRVIRGQGGELYYTPDHYRTFIPLN